MSSRMFSYLARTILLACSVAQLCLTLCSPVDCSHLAPLSIEFFRQECWSGLPCPPSEDLPDPGMEPESPAASALAGRYFTHRAIWEALQSSLYSNKWIRKDTTLRLWKKNWWFNMWLLVSDVETTQGSQSIKLEAHLTS